MIRTISVDDDLVVLIMNYALNLKRSMSTKLKRAISIYILILISLSYFVYYLTQSNLGGFFIFLAIFSLFTVLISGPVFIDNNITGEEYAGDLTNWKANLFDLTKMIKFVKNSYCELQPGTPTNFVIFFIPAENMIYDSERVRNTLHKIILKIKPDLIYEDWQLYLYPISPITPTNVDQSGVISLSKDLEKIINEDLLKASNMLSEDIKQKGIDMSEVYIYLYCIENSLRFFIHDFFVKKHCPSYENKFIISNSVKQKIQLRKEEEQKNKWVGIRGDSFVYYLDFKELGDIIINNKDILQYFPDEIFIKHTINILAKIRNLVAHNSYVGQHEKDILRVNYRMLLQQIKGT